jgi:hypothetical protein
MPSISPRHLRYARYAHFGGSLRSPLRTLAPSHARSPCLALAACPVVTPVPTCLWWDASAPDGGAWSPEGCSVHATSATAVLCACDHLTDFAVRFAALDRPSADVFAGDASVVLGATSAAGAALFGLLAAVVGCVAAGAAGKLRGDAAARRGESYERALSADPEVEAVGAAWKRKAGVTAVGVDRASTTLERSETRAKRTKSEAKQERSDRE